MSDNLNPPTTGVRAWLEAHLQPLLPETWRIVPGISSVKTLLVPAVYFEFTEIQKAAEWPSGHARAVFDVIVIDPRTDLEQGEDGVDDEVVELILALDGHAQINWTVAKKESFAERYFGWRIAVTVLTSTTKE